MNELRSRETARPFSIRFTCQERTALEERAAGQPLGAYVREVVLSDNIGRRTRRKRASVNDATALAQVLAALGRSHLANNLNQLAKAANLGSLPFTAEVEEELSRACAEIHEMRHTLLVALGVDPALRPGTKLSPAFRQSAQEAP